MFWILITLAGALIWLIVLFLTWRPWRTKEFLDTIFPPYTEDLRDITVLIPARNEAEMIETILKGLSLQGQNLKVILIDDQSEDDTVQLANKVMPKELFILPGAQLPEKWSGKLWALEQGLQAVKTKFILLMDADIELLPGILPTLFWKMKEDHLQLISLMAELRMKCIWEKLLMPAFIYFFKLLYPFHLSNSTDSKIAAAAGGCILIETKVLKEIGGFQWIKEALIDDCALAREIKKQGYKTWIGLTRSVRSLRPYNHLTTIWNMVARTAFTQIHYSFFRLLLYTSVFLTAFIFPVIGLCFQSSPGQLISAVGFSAMIVSYLPTLKFYRLSWLWAFAMPLIGLLYLAMTWTSAIRHWKGEGSAWKGRRYCRHRD